MIITLSSSWREAIVVSLIANLALFTLMAGITSREKSEQVDYVPVDMIQLTSVVKQVNIAPSAPAPPQEQQPLPEAKPEPVVEKELGMDKTGVEAAQPAPQQPQTVYHPFHKVTRMPYFKTQVKPVYPASERAVGSQARVLVEVFINQYGGVDDVKIVKSGGRFFDEAVIKAVKTSSFDPAYIEGKPVAVQVQIPYLFKLE